MFTAVLIANRGEIACRIIRTLRAEGIRSVAVYTEADAAAEHVRLADAAVALTPGERGSASGYLSVPAIIAAAERSGADAVHPGYGFLSEQPELARACAAAGLTFIGPSAEVLELMGDKISARARVSARGVPVVPGISAPGLDDAELIAGVTALRFPVLVKPAAGGCGKGMHAVSSPHELPAALAAARREARAAFGDDTLFIEQLIERPRHIEVQIVADGRGTVIHLGERECSLQRRHQKVIEEAPAPTLSDAVRARLAEAAIDTARSVDYSGVGTVEFILSADRPDEFWFMEMNTRLQVEHPVTEQVTGVDLVALQLRAAAGRELGVTQADIVWRGHSIEARIYAEDPAQAFLPTGGTLEHVVLPHGAGIRVEAALRAGAQVTSAFDPMLAKVIATAPERPTAVRRLRAALGDTVTLGVTTNVEFLRRLLAVADVAAGRLDTGLIERMLPGLEFHEAGEREYIAAALALYLGDAAPHTGGAIAPGFRLGRRAPASYRLRVTGRDGRAHTRCVEVRGLPAAAEARIGDAPWQAASIARAGDGGSGHAHDTGSPRDTGELDVVVDGIHDRYRFAHTRAVAADTEAAGGGLIRSVMRLAAEGVAWRFAEVTLEPARRAAAHAPELRSPMPGSVSVLHAADGEAVTDGQAVLSVEAMKMEHVLRAGATGTLALRVVPGQQVAAHEVLAEILPPSEAGPGPETTDALGSAADTEEGAAR